MSIMSNDPTESRPWRTSGHQAPVRLFLTATDGDAAALAEKRAAGFPIELVIVPLGGDVSAKDLDGAAAAVIQLSVDDDKAVEKFTALSQANDIPLLAAAFDPPLAFVRALVRGGAHDVIPLPLDVAELETSLKPIREAFNEKVRQGTARHSRMVSVIKAEGGVGATAIITQLATRFATNERNAGREACLIDFDVQFGDAAFQLGLKPQLTLNDLIEAGGRIDGDFLRTVATDHPSGLQIVSAPNAITPLEALSSERALTLVELAMKEFGTVFVDLPTNWTNWSLSMLARSDLVLMVCELTIPSLNRARRQLDLIKEQDLADLDVRVIVNRFEKGLFKKVTREDAERVLGRPVAYTVVNDHATMSSAIERGVPISDIRRRSPLGKDLDTLDNGLAAALGLER